jgi:hypothetical protein
MMNLKKRIVVQGEVNGVRSQFTGASGRERDSGNGWET